MKFKEIIYGIIVFLQFLTSICYFFITIFQFSFDNLVIFIVAISGLYFSIEFGNEFINRKS